VPRSIHVVVGGLFGSESKGRVSASIVTRLMTNAPDAHVTCIRVAGPNAGHVVWAIPPKDLVDADVANNPAPPPMQRFAMRQIPVGFVHPHVRLYIAPGSEVSVAVLESEIHELETAGFQIRDRLYISPQATILDNTHMQRETDLVKSIGSTGKGIGACRADRLMRVWAGAAFGLLPQGDFQRLPRRRFPRHERGDALGRSRARPADPRRDPPLPDPSGRGFRTTDR
jgi:adenylosuccinate synthase